MEIIKRLYQKAIKGIKEEWLTSSDFSWYNYILNLPTHLKSTYLIVVFHNQVINGGFHQYFSNRYGQFVEETIVTLSKIGAIEKSDILRKAFNVVNYDQLDSESFKSRLIQGRLDKLFLKDDLFDSLEELDTSYYNSNEDIKKLLIVFLKNS